MEFLLLFMYLLFVYKIKNSSRQNMTATINMTKFFRRDLQYLKLCRDGVGCSR
jgi:hypothetical protein